MDRIRTIKEKVVIMETLLLILVWIIGIILIVSFGAMIWKTWDTYKSTIKKV